MRTVVKRLFRPGLPALLLAAVVRPSTSLRRRLLASSALLGLWTVVYARYRRAGVEQTRNEYELLRTANPEAFSLHYNERVPTIEEEFDIWGLYHQHRHEMRYDLLAESVRDHVRPGETILDLGCGSALVADRILDLDATYVGLDFGGHHINYAASKLRAARSILQSAFARGDGEALPFRDESFDVVVMSEVIEHLMRPEHSVWEIARVLKTGGVLVMTTNNASEAPLRSPLSHLFAWLEKALGAYRPKLISLRPWIWPEPVDPTLFSPGAPPVYIPHSHHIYAETRDLFRAAGLETFHFSTFEFPPPQSSTAAWLDSRGPAGRKAVDMLEVAARRTPLVKRLGCHLFMLSRKVAPPVAPGPPPGVWPGPLSVPEPSVAPR
jgi:ubiquinone/menaquinone biosynthesis C-methylase UbiE